MGKIQKSKLRDAYSEQAPNKGEVGIDERVIPEPIPTEIV
ncbi:MAG: hypothetical protein Ct9H90mP30_2040 [Actinomycetota bacterium]|nr:MAG: hypothetical protein Ct9H90mP30_2040 [Actinomycetota bacterium]